VGDPGTRLALAVLRWVSGRRRYGLDQPVRRVKVPPASMALVVTELSELLEKRDELSTTELAWGARMLRGMVAELDEELERRELS
jgi:hypothetical protein